jgi:AmmeMemoRadiSam system protein A
MNESPIGPADQQKLLCWARQAMEAAVHGRSLLEIADSELTADLLAALGAFVTLKKFGELRGCIGKMDFARPLWQNTVEAAVASALEDPRFPPVGPAELGAVRLEIAVVEPPEQLTDLQYFDPQRYGIILEKGFHHALLLPKVAQENQWDALKTLETLCWKAGLPPGSWRAPDARLQVFRAFDFGEPISS